MYKEKKKKEKKNGNGWRYLKWAVQTYEPLIGSFPFHLCKDVSSSIGKDQNAVACTTLTTCVVTWRHRTSTATLEKKKKCVKTTKEEHFKKQVLNKMFKFWNTLLWSTYSILE